MADIQPSKQVKADEPLIPMPSIKPPTSSDDTNQSGSKIQPSASKEKAASESVEPQADQDNSQFATTAEEPTAAKSEPVQVNATASSDLDDIKNKALSELKPIIDEIDLPPEQKFHTILEIISATNDKDMIPKLYEAAEAIEDKHERAKALVDVVSEIEYLSSENA